jgi:hypothetical protein
MLRAILTRLATFIRHAGAPSERATPRDGVLSYASEVHALGIGLAAGLLTGLAVVAGAPVEVLVASPAYVVARWALDLRALPAGVDPHLRDVVAEPAYALFGVASGILLPLAASGLIA